MSKNSFGMLSSAFSSHERRESVANLPKSFAVELRNVPEAFTMRPRIIDSAVSALEVNPGTASYAENPTVVNAVLGGADSRLDTSGGSLKTYQSVAPSSTVQSSAAVYSTMQEQTNITVSDPVALASQRASALAHSSADMLSGLEAVHQGLPTQGV